MPCRRMSTEIWSDVGDQVDLTNVAHKPFIVSPGTDLVSGMVTYEGAGGAPTKSAKYDKTASSGKVYRYFHITAMASKHQPAGRRNVFY